jgi:phenylacetic acid degradation operon negative regulatory protein
MLFGMFASGRHIAVSTGTVIDVLARMEVRSATVRSTLARMTERGLLRRYPNGREAFFGLTDHATSILRRGKATALEDVDRPRSGVWTLLTFSIPEDLRPLRYRLRSRLTWAGFGLLQNGVWVVPHPVDVPVLLQGLDADQHVHAFTAEPTGNTTVANLIRSAYDLDLIADRYAAFTARWRARATADLPDELTATLVLHSEWAQLVQADPRLPLAHLPSGWPAVEARDLFEQRVRDLEPAALTIGSSLMRTMETG